MHLGAGQKKGRFVPAHSDIGFELVPAEPLLLHALPLRRTDSNSPVRRRGGNVIGFVSHYRPGRRGLLSR